MKNKKITRYIAVCLAIIFIAGAFPFQILANPGRPTTAAPVAHTGLQIAIISVANTTQTGNRYTLRLTWSQPPSGNALDTRWHIALPNTPNTSLPSQLIDAHRDGLWTQYASHYDVILTNRTLGTPAGAFRIERDELFELAGNDNPQPGDEVMPGTILSKVIEWDFQPGSLYEIEIIPRNYVPIWDPIREDDGSITPGGHLNWRYDELAEIVPLSGVPPRTMLFMSDIEVMNPLGVDGGITIDWLEPRMGSFRFPYWQFTVVNARNNNPVGTPIYVATEDITSLNVDGRQILRHTVHHPGLQIGLQYVVRVEPVRNEQRQLVRQNMPDGVVSAINIEGVNYSFAFRSSLHEHYYQSRQPVMITPVLTMTEEGEGFIRLYWSRLASGTADRVVVERWSYPFPESNPPPDVLPDGIIAELPGIHATERNWWPVGQITPLRPWAFSIAIYDGDSNIPMARSNLVFFRPGTNEFLPYSPTLEPIIATPPQDGRSSLLLAWHAFTRAPHNDLEEEATLRRPHNQYHTPRHAQLH
jgi:hypothetical protein